MAYGTPADVAALTTRFTNSGAYDETTKPTKAAVSAWLDQISAVLDVLLAEQGFTVPVTQATVVLVLKNFCITTVADLCNYANSAGRFFSEKGLRTGPWATIQKEAADFIAGHAEGLAKLGAAQTTSVLNGLAWNDVDDAGNAIEPMFARKQFGNQTTDWDA